LHAELLCRKLSSMGYDVMVFAPRIKSASKDWHHRKIKVRDERWVKRIYDETTEVAYPIGGSIDSLILEADYDALIIELYGRLPIMEFAKLADRIREKSKLIGVIHVGYRRDIEPILKIKWDALAIFDKRYYDELLRGYDLSSIGRVEEIPYPFAIIENISPLRPSFAEGFTLFFTYGRQPELEYVDYLRALRKLKERYSFKYFVLRSGQKLPIEEPWLCQEIDRPRLSKIYRYLLGADIHLLPKGDTRAVVVSSTIYQCLYSGIPTIVPDTRYFETIPVDERGVGPVVKYRLGDVEDLLNKIELLMQDEALRKEVSENARKYALENSDEKIAKKFLELIGSL